MAAVVLAPLAACSGGVAPHPAAPTSNWGVSLNEPESFEGYTLFFPVKSGRGYLIDHQGRFVHTWALEFPPDEAGHGLLLDNGNLLTRRNREIDPEGNVVWEYRYPQHHDLLELPNGNVLILSHDSVSREEAVALGADPDALSCSNVHGTRIVEARPTGPASAEIVWKWSVFDHLVQDFDPEKPNYGDPSDRPERVNLNYALAEAPCRPPRFADWIHANALDYNAALDQIMVTARNFGEIWIIDRTPNTEEAAGSSGGNAGKGGDLLYRWGNPRAYGVGTLPDQRLFWPHAGRWIPDGSPGAGNALVFNNGREYPGFERGYSSVDEVALPYDGYNYRRGAGAYEPDEVAWTYAADPPASFYAGFKSNAQRLPNGNTLIADGVANRNRIFEVTREGEVVWDFASPIAAPSSGIDRAYRYPPDHPGLRHLDLTPLPTNLLSPAAGEPLARSAFDVYMADGYLVYVKEQCGHSDLTHLFYLRVLPGRANDPQETRRRREPENVELGTLLNFELGASLSDGKCAARIPLPDYPVAAVRTGQRRLDESALWTAQLWLNPEPYRTTYLNARAREPLARSTFDLYAADGALIYVKEQCGQNDIAHPFFLHTVPERPGDLPEARREVGFENLDFDFFLRGALFDGKCAARIPMPDYPVASIRTGQFIGGEGELWSAELAMGGRIFRR